MKLIAILEAGFVNYTREENSTNDPTQSDQQFDLNGEQRDPDSVHSPNDEGESDGSATRQDPDRQGSIRTVADAHLVYKRKNENNLYDELWIYKQNQHDTWTTRTYSAILAGSDIPKGATSSPDGSQTVEKWEVGDPKNTLVFVNIKGLAN